MLSRPIYVLICIIGAIFGFVTFFVTVKKQFLHDIAHDRIYTIGKKLKNLNLVAHTFFKVSY